MDHKKNPHAVALGKKGRRAMTEAQAIASRANGKKGGAPKKVKIPENTSLTS